MENMNIDLSNNQQFQYVFEKEYFVERDFEEVEDGNYNEDGFYVTPDGSFWDPEGDYFNKYGYDKYGGTYDQYKVYIPGDGWLEEFQCYQEDLNQNDEEKIREILNDRFEESCMNTQEVLNMMEFEDRGENHNLNQNTSFNSNLNSVQKSQHFNSQSKNSHNNQMDIDLKENQSQYHSNSHIKNENLISQNVNNFN